jgi:hypothetical protein
MSCYMCSGSHSLYKCPAFAGLSAVEREKVVKAKSCCLNCFSPSHSAQECKSKFSCSTCKVKHNTLLHGCQPAGEMTKVLKCGSSDHLSPPTLLCTAMVKVKDAFGNDRICRALVDNGSESSIVTQKCVDMLGLKPSRCDIEITGVSSMSLGKARGIVGLSLEPLIKDFNFEVNCLVFNQVTGRLPSFPCSGKDLGHLRGLPLAGLKFLLPREVDILLGGDVFGFLLLPGKVYRDRVSPYALATELGWIVSGPTIGYPDQGDPAVPISRYESIHPEWRHMRSSRDFSSWIKSLNIRNGLRMRRSVRSTSCLLTLVSRVGGMCRSFPLILKIEV